VAIAGLVLWAAVIYALVGAEVAFAFAFFGGVRRAVGQRVSFGARLFILPGAVLLWPLVLRRWERGP
jgi:hypothetical protein